MKVKSPVQYSCQLLIKSGIQLLFYSYVPSEVRSPDSWRPIAPPGIINNLLSTLVHSFVSLSLNLHAPESELLSHVAQDSWNQTPVFHWFSHTKKSISFNHFIILCMYMYVFSWGRSHIMQSIGSVDNFFSTL